MLTWLLVCLKVTRGISREDLLFFVPGSFVLLINALLQQKLKSLRVKRGYVERI